MKMCLETSAIIGFLKDEPDCRSIEKLLALSESGQIELFVSSFAWEEAYKPLLDELGTNKKERLMKLTKHLPKVARIGEWTIGSDILGHNDSSTIELTLSKASRSDKEQFLSYAALGIDFFITKDKDFLKKLVRTRLEKEYGFQIGTAHECLDWIRQRGIY
jgi:hypothetical protein